MNSLSLLDTSAACETIYNCPEYTDMLFPVHLTDLIISVHIAYISYCMSFLQLRWAEIWVHNF